MQGFDKLWTRIRSTVSACSSLVLLECFSCRQQAAATGYVPEFCLRHSCSLIAYRNWPALVQMLGMCTMLKSTLNLTFSCLFLALTLSFLSQQKGITLNVTSESTCLLYIVEFVGIELPLWHTTPLKYACYLIICHAFFWLGTTTWNVNECYSYMASYTLLVQHTVPVNTGVPWQGPTLYTDVLENIQMGLIIGLAFTSTFLFFQAHL